MAHEDKKSVNFGQAIVIPGEAPETDDEDESFASNSDYAESGAHMGTSNLTRRSSVPSPASKYDSLLQRKLRENHQNLDRHVSEYYSKTVEALGKDMKRISQSIGTAQTAVQDAACSIRSVADVLYKVEENFDVIFNCQFMPDLQMNLHFPIINKYQNNPK